MMRPSESRTASLWYSRAVFPQYQRKGHKFGKKLRTNGGGGQDGEPLVAWLGGVVEDSAVVGVVGETEAGSTLC